MRILYHHRIASKDGQYVHIEEMITSLRKLGHEVLVCQPGSIEKREFGKGSRSVQRMRSLLPGFVHELAEYLYNIKDYWNLKKAVKAFKPDFIYERYNLFFSSGVWASRKFGLPLILEVNAPLYLERSKNDGISLSRLARRTEDYAWQSADAVLPVTAVLGEMIRQRGVPESRITVIPNGISKQFIADHGTAGSSEGNASSDDRLVLGFTGFVRKWHQLDRVLQSISAHKESNWHLLLVGDGPDRQRLERLASDLGVADRLTVTGVVSRKEVPGLVKKFDIALQPDVVPYASPLKLFEYMALGKAIIAPNMANIREILTDDENALLFDPSNESFHGKLIQICENHELRLRLGVAARAEIDKKQLYWDSNASRVIELYGSLSQ